MSKYNRKLNVVYPADREDRVKDANRKLKAQIKNLNKVIKRLESENKTLSRAFNKSCDFIQQKLSNKTLKEITRMIDSFDYKETERGRIREEIKKEKQNNEKTCPKCSAKDSLTKISTGNFIMNICKCGYRKKTGLECHEGNERS